MKILMTGPDNNPSRSLGGITTIVNIILRNNPARTSFFDRDLGEHHKPVTYIRKFFSFLSVLKKEKPDAIHFHFSFDIKSVIREAAYLWVTRKNRIPVIIHLHGGLMTYHKDSSPLVRWSLKVPHKLIVLNEAEKESLCRLYNVPAQTIEVLRNCIDFNEIPAFPITTVRPNRIIYFGRIHRDKGLREIVEAMQLLTASRADFSLEVYGTGPDQTWFTEKLKEVLQCRFEYKGLVWGDQKWQALNNADIFLLPSYAEGMPMALLEAMALGKVAIVSDDDSFKKVIKHNVNGMLTRKRSSQDLAEKILCVLSDPRLQQRIGTSAKASMEAEYGADFYMGALNRIYMETVGWNKDTEVINIPLSTETRHAS